jgi:nitrite reductase/ring-hydroxylating ferredoxin subunit
MPLFRSTGSGADANGFFQAGPAGDIGLEQMRLVDAGGEAVIVTRLQDGFYAFSATCPHAAGDLRKGEIYRGRIDCPEHEYRFDVRSGRTLWPPDELCRLKHFDIEERAGQLLIRPRGRGGR